MAKKLPFNDITVLSTPNPICSSSMTCNSGKKLRWNLNDIPERDLDSDASLGLISIKSDESYVSPAAMLQKERDLAISSLKRTEIKSTPSTDVKSIPSRFLKPSDFTDTTTFDRLVHSESTINESDLLPGNSSTPRESFADAMRGRSSLSSHSIQDISELLKNPSIGMDTIQDAIRKSLTQESFCPGEDIMSKLQKDEMSWRNKRHLPTEMMDFSVSNRDLKLSMGNFFKERSDDPSQMFAKSPRKSHKPTPLIEVTTLSEAKSESLDASDIQRILSLENTKDAIQMLDVLKLNNSEKKSSVKEEQSLPEMSKENISPKSDQEKPIRSILSPRCSSSLSSLPNGKLPIATTRTELIWGCVKPGKCISRDFILRNRSSYRFGMNCSVSNPSFRFNKEGSDTSMIKVILHPYESRNLTITFAPTSLGAVVDTLNFVSLDPNHNHTVKQFIKLYGYGGHGKVTFSHLIKDTSGKYLLCLGNIDEHHSLNQKFLIKNQGSLATFAYFEFISSGLYSFSNVAVSPQTAILLPGEEQEINLTFNAQKKDFVYIKSKINNSVLDFGKLQIIYGTEVDRARLRKVSQKAIEKGHTTIEPSVERLIDKFPGEVIPTDLKQFKEAIHSMEEILKLFVKEEIVVTVEQAIDLSNTGSLEDETEMFHSLCENLNSDTLQNTCIETCHVEPTRIILTPPDKLKDRIFLTNNNKKKIYFETNSTPEGLLLKPDDGTIKPGETAIIEVQYTKTCKDKTVFKVRLLVDNESFEVDVKVMFVCKTS